MLKCCNKDMQILESIDLYNTDNQVHRILTVARCKNQNCGCLKAQITFWDKAKEKFGYIQIPRNKIHETVELYKKQPYLVNPAKIKHGSRANMFWKYQNRGNIYDFNNTLVGKVKTEVQYGRKQNEA